MTTSATSDHLGGRYAKITDPWLPSPTPGVTVGDLIEDEPARSLHGGDPVHLAPRERPSRGDSTDVICMGLDKAERCEACTHIRLVSL